MNSFKSAIKHAARYSLFALALTGFSQTTLSQSVEDVRWKSEEQVRAMYGEPESISEPVGTHATYSLWKYENFTVAFANNRAFHLFDKDSLRKFELEEDRPDY